MIDVSAVQGDLRDLLIADAALLELVSADAIGDALAAEKPPVPAIGISGGDSFPDHYEQGRVSSESLGFALEAWAYNPDTLRTIVGHIVRICDGASLAGTGYRPGPLLVERTSGHLFEHDSKLHRWIVTLSVTATPTS